MTKSEINSVLDNVYKQFPNMGLAELLDAMIKENRELRAEIESLKNGLNGPSQEGPSQEGSSISGQLR